MNRILFVPLLALPLAACEARTGAESAGTETLSDPAFAELQALGAAPTSMGFDQYTSVHRFDDLPDGGRIELQRAADDPAGVEQIRAHLRHVASAFSRGDFSVPGFVHDRAEVPGARVMREKRAAIAYDFRELPRGGEVRIRTDDPAALQAVLEFMAFQRGEHRAGGHTGH